MKKGFLYIATGKNFIEEAYISYVSLMKHSDLIPATIFVDKENEILAKGKFSDVRIIEEPFFNFIDKIEPLLSSPYEETIFIDSDTYIVEDISGLFDIFSKYDFFASFAPGRGTNEFSPDVPEWFPEYNTGIIGFRNTKGSQEVIENWLCFYKKQLKGLRKPPHDQPSFRSAIFNSNLRIYNLPMEYNFRITNQNIRWANSTVKIIHGRHKNYPELERIINSNPKQIQVFLHDLAFVNKETLKVFRVKQNNLFIFSLFFNFIKFKQKVINRLFSSEVSSKIKGNSSD
jgi:hypothetical protein